MDVTAIIPAYNPDKKFHVVVEGLIQAGFKHIIIVNDGTKSEYVGLFKKVENNKHCVLLHHKVNRGKGRALKTAFKYFLDNFSEDIGVVILDADNQHKVKDVVNCTKELKNYPNSLIIGTRNFDLEYVPNRSRFGNKATSKAFKLLCGLNITDTQSGLRAIPKEFVKYLTKVKGERFEYETNMLLETKVLRVPIREVPIDTVYIDGNTSSNFNPLLDSFTIYKMIFKFVFSSFSSIICDYTLFIVLGFIFSFLSDNLSLLIATFGARLVSSIINFNINRKVVFKNSDRLRRVLFKYYFLATILMVLSYSGIYILHFKMGIPEIIAKIVADVILFLLSFKIQVNWVFK